MTRTVKRSSSFRGDLIEDQVPEWASWQEAAESQGGSWCWGSSGVSSLETLSVGHPHFWEGQDYIGSTSFAHSAAVDCLVTFVHNCVQPPKPTVMSDDLTISGALWMMSSSRSNERRRSNPSWGMARIPTRHWDVTKNRLSGSQVPLGHVTGFVHLYVPLTEKKWPRLSPFLSAPESR